MMNCFNKATFGKLLNQSVFLLKNDKEISLPGTGFSGWYLKLCRDLAGKPEPLEIKG
jgi:hypothetical protein